MCSVNPSSVSGGWVYQDDKVLPTWLLRASWVRRGVSRYDSDFYRQPAKRGDMQEMSSLLLTHVSTLAAPFCDPNLAKLKAFKEPV